MKIIIDVPEEELTNDELEECIRIAKVNLSNVLIFKDIGMRLATDEERQAIQKYIDSISTETDIYFV